MPDFVVSTDVGQVFTALLNSGETGFILASGANTQPFNFAPAITVFVFAASDGAPGVADIITDFRPGQDVIDLQGASGQILAFRGTAGLPGDSTVSVNHAASSGSVIVAVDGDGNGVADMQIVQGAPTAVRANDFLLQRIRGRRWPEPSGRTSPDRAQ